VGNAEGRKDFLIVSRVFSGVFWAGITLDHTGYETSAALLR